MRKLILLLLTSLCVSVHAKDASFSSFLSKLVLTKETSVTETTFGKPIIGDLLDKKVFAKYLPMLANECNCDEDKLPWQGGSYMKKGNYVVAFMQRFNIDCKDGNEKWFMEHIVSDYVMVVYSVSGAIIDSKIIGKNSFIHFTRISGDITKGIVAEQGLLTDASQLSTYEPLNYNVTKHTFTINVKGKIVENVSQPWKEVKEQKQNGSSEEVTFTNYLKYFGLWDKPYIDDSIYKHKEKSELPHSFVTAFLSSAQECDCWPKNIYWQACNYIEKENFYILFVLRCCDFSKNPEPRYAEKLILTYDKTGKMIDFRSLGKSSEKEGNKIEAERNSLIIGVTEYNIKKYREYTVDLNGKIN